MGQLLQALSSSLPSPSLEEEPLTKKLCIIVFQLHLEISILFTAFFSYEYMVFQRKYVIIVAPQISNHTHLFFKSQKDYDVEK